MSRLTIAAFAAALALASPLAAQPAAPAATAALDPVKLAKAQRVVQTFFPANTRQKLINEMMDAVSATMRQTLAGSPPIAALVGDNPARVAVLERFLDRQNAEAKQDLQDSLPDLLEAMATAYARRFSTSQLDELAAFFETSTGRAYARESIAIMSDPDIARVQQAMMARSLERMPAAVAALIEELGSAPQPIPGT
jgi:hypothetical protein